MASKIAQDGPSWTKMGSNMPPRDSQTAPRGLQAAMGPSMDTPERPKSLKSLIWKTQIYNVSLCVAFSLLVSFRGLKTPPRSLKGPPEEAQKGPKTAPNVPKSTPRAPQQGPQKRFVVFRRGGFN